MNKHELNVIQETIEEKCGENVRAVFAQKPGWILLKTVEHMKTFGCIRLNKKSYITLYIDTKEGIRLDEKLVELESFNGDDLDIKSRETGNFVQNKIKFFSENQINLAVQAINKVFEDNLVKKGKRVRHK